MVILELKHVGWRYLDQLEEFLTEGLPEAVHLEALLLLQQIRQIRTVPNTSGGNELLVRFLIRDGSVTY